MRIDGRKLSLRLTWKAMEYAEEFYPEKDTVSAPFHAVAIAAGNGNSRAIAAIMYGMLRDQHDNEITEESFYSLMDQYKLHPVALWQEVMTIVKRDLSTTEKQEPKKKTMIQRLLRR